MTHRLASHNTRTGCRVTGLTVYPEHIAQALAERLNAMPAMIREGIVWSAVEVGVKAAGRASYAAHLRGEG